MFDNLFTESDAETFDKSLLIVRSKILSSFPLDDKLATVIGLVCLQARQSSLM